MSLHIVDRRLDSKHKSSVNRARFIERFKGQIRKAVADAINKRSVRDIDNGEKILIAEHDGQDVRIPFDAVLVAVGRAANESFDYIFCDY